MRTEARIIALKLLDRQEKSPGLLKELGVKIEMTKKDRGNQKNEDIGKDCARMHYSNSSDLYGGAHNRMDMKGNVNDKDKKVL